MFHDTEEVDFQPAACWACDKLDVPWREAQRAEDFFSNFHFFNGFIGQRYADRVADPFRQQGSYADSRFDGADLRRARFGNAEMQRDVGPLGDKPVGLDHELHVGRFHGYDNVVKIEIVADPDMPHRALKESFGCRVSVFFQNVFLERAWIHSDANRNIPRLRRRQHLFDTISRADVSGIQPDLCYVCFDGFEREDVVEMNICDDRNRREFYDLRDGVCSFFVIHRYPDDVASPIGCGTNLSHGCGNIRGFWLCHGLDGNRRVPADKYSADIHLSGLAPDTDLVGRMPGLLRVNNNVAADDGKC